MNFFYYSIHDRFIQRQPCECMRAFVNFFVKNFFSETIDWIFTKISQECSSDRGLKLLFTVTEKSGLWSNTGAYMSAVQVL